jgi:hypothetical protein
VAGPLIEVRAMGRTCAAHRHREDVPIEVHHIWPLGAGGPDTRANRIALCANAHGSVHFLLDRANKLGGYPNVPWSYRRRFGPAVRKLAERGWTAIAAHHLKEGR